MSFLKAVVSALTMPLTIAFVLLMAALVLRFFGRGRLAVASFAGAVVFGTGCSMPVMGNVFLFSLEARYPPLREAALLPADVPAIVVLGSYYHPYGDLPVTAAVSAEGVARASEGIRLALRFPSARLVLSGGDPRGRYPSAHGYALLARQLGIPEERVTVLDKPRDTAQEAGEIVKLLGNQRFLLVTSASHMPRAMILMERAGGRPIAAPTAHRTRGTRFDGWRDLVPSSTGLNRSEMAWHEYMGLAAISLGLD